MSRVWSWWMGSQFPTTSSTIYLINKNIREDEEGIGFTFLNG
ncbi:MAG: hypothetical protein PHS84_02280 [Paludibacter sp.]|nr:hypothetical protein [Paludibacter sp.]